MKILYVTLEYPNNGLNAAQVRANQVLSRLENEVDLHVFAYKSPDYEQAVGEASNITYANQREFNVFQKIVGTISPYSRSFKRYNSFEATTKLNALIQEFQPDIIHFDMFSSLGLLFGDNPIVHNAKIVAQTHDAVSRHLSDRLKTLKGLSWLLDHREWSKIVNFEKKYLCQSDLIIVDSERDADYLSDINSNNNVTIVPLGFEKEDFSEVGPKAKLQQPSIVFTGSMQNPQSVDASEFLTKDIMPLLWQTHPDVHLYIVGANPGPEITELASERVHITGFVDDLSIYLRSATLYVCPLRIGSGMRTRVVEALACGVAMIITDEGAQGLVVPPEGNTAWVLANSASEIVEEIKQYLNTDLLELKKSATHYAYSNYSWDHVVEKLVEEYKTLLSN